MCTGDSAVLWAELAREQPVFLVPYSASAHLRSPALELLLARLVTAWTHEPLKSCHLKQLEPHTQLLERFVPPLSLHIRTLARALPTP